MPAVKTVASGLHLASFMKAVRPDFCQILQVLSSLGRNTIELPRSASCNLLLAEHMRSSERTGSPLLLTSMGFNFFFFCFLSCCTLCQQIYVFMECYRAVVQESFNMYTFYFKSLPIHPRKSPWEKWQTPAWSIKQDTVGFLHQKLCIAE